MPQDLIMRRIGDGLAAVDMEGMEFIHSLPMAKDVKVKVTKSRNLDFHRMYWGALSHLFNHQNLYSVKYDLHDDICIILGHCELVTYRGKQKYRAKSISFAAMDDISFRQYFESFVKVASERIAPSLPESELRQFYRILDGNSGKLGSPIATKKTA